VQRNRRYPRKARSWRSRRCRTYSAARFTRVVMIRYRAVLRTGGTAYLHQLPAALQYTPGGETHTPLSYSYPRKPGFWRSKRFQPPNDPFGVCSLRSALRGHCCASWASSCSLLGVTGTKATFRPVPLVGNLIRANQSWAE
jgi:hypothetical protein